MPTIVALWSFISSVVAELERPAGEEQDVARLVDDDRVRLAQPFPGAQHHLRGARRSASRCRARCTKTG